MKERELLKEARNELMASTAGEGRYNFARDLLARIDAALAEPEGDEANHLKGRIAELEADVSALVKACNDLQGPIHMGEPVVPECESGITVQRRAIDYLKEHCPELCIKSGLCERVGGRIYTKTLLPAHSALRTAQTVTPVHSKSQFRRVKAQGGVPAYECIDTLHPVSMVSVPREWLENAKRRHDYCEDNWYSCPKHEDGCADERETECNCGADAWNAEIEAMLAASKGEV